MSSVAKEGKDAHGLKLKVEICLKYLRHSSRGAFCIRVKASGTKSK